MPLKHPIFDACRVFPKKTLVRASNEDQRFKNFLVNLRLGKFTPEVIAVFKERQTLAPPENALRVFVPNREADEYKTNALNYIPGRIFYYRATDNGGATNHSTTFRETGLHANLIFNLNVPVMLFHNVSVENQLSNGTIAFVQELHPASVLIARPTGETLLVKPYTQFVYNSSISRTKIPLSLAFATTIHKIQSLTILTVAVCITEDFRSHGQLYVAYSRVKIMDDLFFLPRFSGYLFVTKTDSDCIRAIESIEGNVL